MQAFDRCSDKADRQPLQRWGEWGSERVRDCGLSDLPDEEDDLTNDRNVIADPMNRRICIAYCYVGINAGENVTLGHIISIVRPEKWIWSPCVDSKTKVRPTRRFLERGTDGHVGDDLIDND